MAEQLPHLKVVEPVGPAIERVKAVLFRPFDIGKWFIIGFCAWLAGFGENGGPSLPNFNFSGGSEPSPQRVLEDIKDFILNNLHWLIPLAIFGCLLLIATGLVFLWLGSRGKFMFLHCVAKNKSEVSLPWHKYKKQGNSLFLFRFVVGIISFVLFTIIAVPLFLLVLLCTRNPHAAIAAAVLGLIFIGLLAFIVAIAFAVFIKFTKDFVVPVMYLQNCSAVAGWRLFLPILSHRIGVFILYILFQFVIGLAIFGIKLGLAIVTCCSACCLMAIPYIGTVFLLPISVFQRSYSLYFLRQLGPEFDVFIPEPVVPLPQA